MVVKGFPEGLTLGFAGTISSENMLVAAKDVNVPGRHQQTDMH